MTSRKLKAHLAFLAPLALVTAAAPTAVAQAPIAWESKFYDAPNLVNQVVELLPAPGDGIAVVMGSRATADQQSPRTVVVAGLSENGDQRWVWRTPGSTVAGDTDAAENVYVLYLDPAGDSKLASLSSAGALRWLVDVEPPPAGFLYSANALDVADDGSCRVAGYTLNGNAFPRTIVHAIDPTGALQWRFDRSAGSAFDIPWGYPFRVALSPTGETYVIGQEDFCCGGQTWMVQVLSPSGTLLLEEAGASSSFFTARFGAHLPSGDYAMAYHGVTTPFGVPSVPSLEMRIYSGSATPTSVGLIPFADPMLGNLSIRDLEVDGAGDIWIGIESPHTVLRFDATGAFLSSWPAPARIQSLCPTDDGGAFILCEGQTADEVELHRMDAGGAVLRSETRAGRSEFTSLSGPPDIQIDARGNGFFATVTDLSLDPNGSHASTTKWIDGVAVGSPYCGPAVVNSAGGSARIRGFGSDRASDDNITLISSGMPVNAMVLLVGSTTPGLVAGAGGSAGNLCLGGSIGRFLGPGQVRRTLPSGSVSLQLDLDRIPEGLGFRSVMAGETWRFQSWFRDLVGGVQGSNFTDGIAITFQ